MGVRIIVKLTLDIKYRYLNIFLKNFPQSNNEENYFISSFANFLILFLWAPWMDNQAIHDKVFKEKAHKDGTIAWVIYPDGTRKYELICDYKVK